MSKEQKILTPQQVYAMKDELVAANKREFADWFEKALKENTVEFDMEATVHPKTKHVRLAIDTNTIPHKFTHQSNTHVELLECYCTYLSQAGWEIYHDYHSDDMPTMTSDPDYLVLSWPRIPKASEQPDPDLEYFEKIQKGY